MKRVNLRLDVTEAERDLIRKAAALAGYRSMAEFCRAIVMKEAASVATNVAPKNETGAIPRPNA